MQKVLMSKQNWRGDEGEGVTKKRAEARFIVQQNQSICFIRWVLAQARRDDWLPDLRR